MLCQLDELAKVLPHLCVKFLLLRCMDWCSCFRVSALSTHNGFSSTLPWRSSYTGSSSTVLQDDKNPHHTGIIDSSCTSMDASLKREERLTLARRINDREPAILSTLNVSILWRSSKVTHNSGPFESVPTNAGGKGSVFWNGPGHINFHGVYGRALILPGLAILNCWNRWGRMIGLGTKKYVTTE